MSIFNKPKKEIDIETAFRENLKYISKTEVNPSDIEGQFIKSDTRYYLTVGEIDCPTGNIIVADPLCYLLNETISREFKDTIPLGKYPVEVSICRNDIIGIRMTTARLKIKQTKAVKYILASPMQKNDENREPLCGFPVEAGMMCFCDKQVAEEYRSFLDDWYKENPDGNHYDDYFAKFFKESEEKLPAYQRKDGDFIEWTNPKTNNKMVMIASGLGDGFYQSFWGYDKDNEICELIVPMVNPDLFE